MRATTRFATCALADMGRCVAPCDGRATRERYGARPGADLTPARTRTGSSGRSSVEWDSLAAEERYEEALARDRLRALAEGLARSRADGWLVGAGSLCCAGAERNRVRFRAARSFEPTTRSRSRYRVPRDRAGRAGGRAILARPQSVQVEVDLVRLQVVGGSAIHWHLLARLRAGAGAHRADSLSRR